jgi:hypothetical protein
MNKKIKYWMMKQLPCTPCNYSLQAVLPLGPIQPFFPEFNNKYFRNYPPNNPRRYPGYSKLLENDPSSHQHLHTTYSWKKYNTCNTSGNNGLNEYNIPSTCVNKERKHYGKELHLNVNVVSLQWLLKK